MATFVTLRTDSFARGYDFMNDGGAKLATANRWINQAYLELCEEALWPFLLATATGAAPLAVADLRSIKTVTDTVTGRPLRPVPEDELLDTYTTLATSGGAEWFYVDDTTVRTYPTTATLSVRYWKVPTALSGDADVAIVPDRFCGLIVDGFVRRAALEDAPEASRAAEAERQQGIALMRQSLFLRDGVRHYQRQSDMALDR